LKKGIPPDATDNQGGSAMHVAAFFGHSNFIRLLAKYGARGNFFTEQNKQTHKQRKIE